MPKTPRFLHHPEGSSLKQFTADLAENKSSIELVGDHEQDSVFFRELESTAIHLNRSQISAVRHGTGPALVLAGAGSGKTRVLTARTAYLIKVRQVPPENIMLVTFSKKAADEMKERLAQMPGLSTKQANAVTSGTFHSIFWKLLKSRGYNQKIISSEKQKQIAIKLLLKEKKLQDAYEPETLLALLSSTKNNALTVSDLPADSMVDREIKTVLQSYEQWKSNHNYFDFDDMLLESYHLLLSDPGLLQSMQNRFQYIQVDEWQDTNPLQYQLVKMMAAPSDHLFVVGDDDQTIYSFNGADQAIIMDFKKRYSKATVFTLDVNYRSSANILGIANQVIARNSVRNKKQLKATKTNSALPLYLRPATTDQEAALVIEQINKLTKEENRSYKDIVILHRTVSSSRAIVDELVRTRIPFVSFSKGDSFYEQNLVKPVIDYLRLMINPGDTEAIKGITPTLYINRESAIQHIQMEQLIEQIDEPIKHLLSLPGLQEYQKRKLRDRIALISSLKDKEPIEAVRSIRKFYDEYLQADERSTVTMHKDLMMETLAEIESAANQFSSISDFLQFIDNVIIRHNEMEKLRNNRNVDAVSLMTIHRAKGLEFPVVFLIGASENILPHSSSLQAENRKDLQTDSGHHTKSVAALEEERRLAYVAITRAEEELYISSPSYYRGESVDISRFLLDPFLSGKEKGNSSAPSGKTVKTLVWKCTRSSCICWMRIEDEKKLETDRKCPMCKAPMQQAMKEIPS